MSTPRPIGFWLKLVDRLIDEQFASTLDEHGVTRRQWQLLNVLTHEPASEEALDAAVAPFLVEQESSREHLAELLDSGWVTLDAATYADVDDLMRDVGFKPSTSIEDGVARFVAWYREYHGV